MTTRPEDDEEETSNFYAEDGEALDEADGAGAVDPRDWPTDISALDLELCALPANDLGNAKRLQARNAGHLWWTKELGPAAWDGKRFDFDHGETGAGRMAQSTSERMLSHEFPAFYETQKRRNEPAKDWIKRYRAFAGFCLQAGNNQRTESMMAQHERAYTRPLAVFDADPDVMTLANGTLVLPRDGSPPRFTPTWDPALLSTKVAGAAYDPKATAPLFLKFLEQVMPDREDRDFLARVIGYCLTGHIMEQAYFIFQGKGGDGKSTFLEAIAAAMGGYVANAGIETFLHREKKGSEASPDIARLATGVRLVKAAEPEQGARLAEALLKLITGGEPFPARAMYKEPFEFVPTWKLIISCNHKPQIRGGDRGIWRRTLVLPWPVSVPEEQFDKQLPAKLKAEASGILNWALAGWSDWVERGKLDPSPNVKAAVAEYRLNSDPCAAWFDMCCITKDVGEYSESASRLYQSYRGWATEGGFEVMKQTAFGRWLSNRGLDRRRSNGIHWGPVKLNDAGEEALRNHDQQEQDRRYGPVAGGDD